MTFTLFLPVDFDDYAWEVELKGCFDNVFVDFGNGKYQLSFYDPVRLNQEIQDSFDLGITFFTEHIVVVKRVNRAVIEETVKGLYEARQLRGG